LRGAGVRDELKATRQQDLLLDVLPFDVECRRIQGNTVIEPGGLRTELVVPQRVGFEATRVRERDVRVYLAGYKNAVTRRTLFL
jgi:hypothetical protein